MNLSVQKKILYVLIALLFVGGLCVATGYDLVISSSLSGLSQSDGTLSLSVPLYAKILEVFGEWPAVIVACISAEIVQGKLSERNHKKGMLARSFFSGAAVVLLFNATNKTLSACFTIDGIAQTIVAALFVGLLLSSLSLFVSRLSNQTKERLFLPAVYTLIAAAAILIVVSGIKGVWGRVRLRELVALNSLESFSPWYLPNFFSGSHSFPSGHTAHNTLMLMLPTWLFGKGKSYRTFAYVVCALYIAAMAFSRLAAGAHYLSDILFGFLIAFVITECTKFHLRKRVDQESPK